jgi:hypothetical protein
MWPAGRKFDEAAEEYIQRQGEIIVKCTYMKRMDSDERIGMGALKRKGAHRCQFFGLSVGSVFFLGGGGDNDVGAELGAWGLAWETNPQG